MVGAGVSTRRSPASAHPAMPGRSARVPRGWTPRVDLPAAPCGFGFRAAGRKTTVEHEEQAERLEREADDMEHQAGKVGDHSDRTRRDWDAKEEDAAVPGAQPDPGEEEEPVPGAETDEETVREEGGP